MKLAAAMGFQWPSFAPTPLQKLIPHASPEAIEMVQALCHWDPNRRPTAVQCLQMPFFQVGIQRTPRLDMSVAGADPLDSSIDLGDSGLSPLLRPQQGISGLMSGGGSVGGGQQPQPPPPPSRRSSDFGDILADELNQAEHVAQRLQQQKQREEQQQERAQQERANAIAADPFGGPQQTTPTQGKAQGAGQLSSNGSWGGFAPLTPQEEDASAGGGAPPFRAAGSSAAGAAQAPQRTPSGLPPPPKFGLPAVPALSGVPAGGPLAPSPAFTVGRRGRDSTTVTAVAPDSLEEMLARTFFHLLCLHLHLRAISPLVLLHRVPQSPTVKPFLQSVLRARAGPRRRRRRPAQQGHGAAADDPGDGAQAEGERRHGRSRQAARVGEAGEPGPQRAVPVRGAEHGGGGVDAGAGAEGGDLDGAALIAGGAPVRPGGSNGSRSSRQEQQESAAARRGHATTSAATAERAGGGRRRRAQVEEEEDHNNKHTIIGDGTNIQQRTRPGERSGDSVCILRRLLLPAAGRAAPPPAGRFFLAAGGAAAAGGGGAGAGAQQDARRSYEPPPAAASSGLLKNYCLMLLAAAVCC